jgi:hypothetical protein
LASGPFPFPEAGLPPSLLAEYRAGIAPAVTPKQSEGKGGAEKPAKAEGSNGADLTPKEQRDKWIYHECMKGTPYQTIAIRLNKKPKKWSRIESANGIKMAAERYAERHSLPKPPTRQSGRCPR